MLKQTKVLTSMLLIVTIYVTQLNLACPNVYAEMQDDVKQAISILEKFQEIPEQAIPPAVLQNAKGLAILTIGKVGFVLSGRGGTGIVLARTESGWSGPSAIGSGGIGLGFQIGAQVSEFIIVLNTPNAVQAFSQTGNVSLGVDLSAAAGPVGRSADVDVMPLAAVYTYSRSQGLFLGISLEGTVIGAREDANAKYYGRQVEPSEILSGKVKPPAPEEVKKLLRILDKY